jgi:hypothetical protein
MTTETTEQKTNRWFLHGFNEEEKVVYKIYIDILNQYKQRIAILDKELESLKK